MRIETLEGSPIETMNDWARLYDTPRLRVHWKEHRSAHTIADFMLNRQGAAALQQRVAAVIAQQVSFERAVPEYEVRFDGFGKGRVHDLAIFGSAASGESLFVGVESKVDERFNNTVREVYLKAKAKEIRGIPTNAARRIEQLLRTTFTEPDETMFDVRYQLLYAVVGTLAASADISVLYVTVFETPLYDPVVGAENLRDYVDYMRKVGAESMDASDASALVHVVKLGEKRLHCIHERFAVGSGQPS